MKQKITFIAVLFLLILNTINAQNSLRIIPTDWWGGTGEQGTIEDASFTISPQGAYTQIGVILTLSAKGTYYEFEDNLEIILDFNLPEGSIIHDSWLWMLDDETIVRADVRELFTATTIYEDIVDQNMDPSLLYQKDNGNYKIRIFPLAGNHFRKIKINYLVPAIWTAESINTWLPLDILNTSRTPIESFKVITFFDDKWKNPRFDDFDELVFETDSNPGVEDYLSVQIPFEYAQKPLVFSVDAPFNDENYFIQKLDDADNNFYQIAYLPPELPRAEDPKKVLFLVDHEDANTHVDKNEIRKYLEKTCFEYLGAEDHFNFMFSHPTGPKVLSYEWINADPTMMASYFESETLSVQNHSDLAGLLDDAFDFVKWNGQVGEIILLTSSGDLNISNINSYVQNILNQIEELDIGIHIINYQSKNAYYDWDSAIDDYALTYRNKYFYEQLTLATTGRLYDPFEGSSSIWQNISSLMGHIKFEDYNFDLHTTLESGFTFNRYFQNFTGSSVNQDQAILQIGRYAGEFPFKVEFSAIQDNLFTYEDFEIAEDQIIQSDSLTREIWYGHYIKELEGTSDASDNVQDIIDLSKAERVLSKYTAFLALDLEQGGEPCADCDDYDDSTVSVNEVIESTEKDFIKINISSNPFSDYCKIDIELLDTTEDELIIYIFDNSGKMVFRKVINVPSSGKVEMEWDGRNQIGDLLPSGMYYFVVEVDGKIKTEKLNISR